MGPGAQIAAEGGIVTSGRSSTPAGIPGVGLDGRRVAVIDIGTNTLLLLIAEAGRTRPGAQAVRAVRDECGFGRLGKGLDQTGRLDPGAVAKSLAILREYRAAIDELGVDAIRAVGTQALREAENSGDFVEPAQAILGAPIEIIAGEREAQLVHRAVSESFPDLAEETFAIADVGGGSTEIIVASPAGVESFVSVPIGSVRMHERHLHSDPPTPEQARQLVDDIDAALMPLQLPDEVCLVGSAGTATTIASVELQLEHYDPDRVQGFEVPRQVVERQLERYLELTVAQRRELPGLEPERADVIDGGVAIFVRLLQRMNATRFVVNGGGGGGGSEASAGAWPTRSWAANSWRCRARVRRPNRRVRPCSRSREKSRRSSPSWVRCARRSRSGAGWKPRCAGYPRSRSS